MLLKDMLRTALQQPLRLQEKILHLGRVSQSMINWIGGLKRNVLTTSLQRSHALLPLVNTTYRWSDIMILTFIIIITTAKFSTKINIACQIHCTANSLRKDVIGLGYVQI